MVASLSARSATWGDSVARPSTRRVVSPAARRLAAWTITAALVALPAVAARGSDRVEQALSAVAQREKLPAADVRSALDALRPDDIADLCGRLVAPGQGDDRSARLALHALAFYASDPARPQRRAPVEQALMTALPRLAGEPRGFVLEQLALLGTPACVPAVAACLVDAENASAAVAALVSIGGADALAALRAAFERSEGATRVAVVNALNRLGARGAADDLLRHARSNDLDLRAACLDALAACGATAAGEALLDAVSASAWFDYTRAVARMVRYARALADNGDTEPAAELLEALLKLDESDAFTHMRMAALGAWGSFDGGAQLNRIMAKSIDANLEIRAMAIDVAARIPSDRVVPALLELLKHPQAGVRAAGLSVLGRRDDARPALDAILAALSDESTEVRVAAIRAAARVGGADVTGELLKQAESPREEVRDALRAELERFPGAAASTALADAMSTASPAGRALALEVLAARRARSVAGRLPALLDDPDEAVRVAALHAIGVLCGEEALPELLRRAGHDSSEIETQALEQTLANCARRVGQGDIAAAPILAAIDPGRPRACASLLRAVGQIAGPAAFRAVSQAAGAEAAEIRAAAAQALHDWPDPAAAEDLLRIAGEATDEKLGVLAFRGFARLAALDPQRDPRQKVELLHSGLTVARRAEERKLVLSRIGEVGDAASLEMLEAGLADAELRQEAAWALMNVCDRIVASHAHRVAQVLGQIEKAGVSGVQPRMEALRARLREFEGQINDWFVSGPYEQAGRGGTELFDVAFAPESPGRQGVRWKPQPPGADAERSWMVDLGASVGGDHRVAYLLTQVYSPAAQPARLEVGSDDGIKIWLNGAVVHANNVARGCQRGDDRVDIELHKGWNELLVKVNNLGGGWGACVRVAGRDGKPLEGVYAQAEATP